MSDEEKKAIESLIEIREFANLSSYKDTKISQLNSIDMVLNLIEKQSKEIEHQIEKRANQKKELAILNAKQIEFNKLVNTVNSYKGQFKKQQKEIEILKEENEKYKNPPFFDEDKYTENDKIKAKIEEYENKIKKIRSKKIINEPEDTIIITRYAHYISVLQSLLEEE